MQSYCGSYMHITVFGCSVLARASMFDITNMQFGYFVDKHIAKEHKQIAANRITLLLFMTLLTINLTMNIL